ncbi:MAG: hypothetical protein U1E30_12760 [Rhodoblastus sp.]
MYELFPEAERRQMEHAKANPAERLHFSEAHGLRECLSEVLRIVAARAPELGQEMLDGCSRLSGELQQLPGSDDAVVAAEAACQAIVAMTNAKRPIA